MYKASTESCKSLSAAYSCMWLYLSRYQISVCVCVRRLMFQLFKLRADSHLKSDNYFKGNLLSNDKNSEYKMHSEVHGCVNCGRLCTRVLAVKLR